MAREWQYFSFKMTVSQLWRTTWNYSCWPQMILYRTKRETQPYNSSNKIQLHLFLDPTLRNVMVTPLPTFSCWRKQTLHTEWGPRRWKTLCPCNIWWMIIEGIGEVLYQPSEEVNSAFVLPQNLWSWQVIWIQLGKGLLMQFGRYQANLQELI